MLDPTFPWIWVGWLLAIAMSFAVMFPAKPSNLKGFCIVLMVSMKSLGFPAYFASPLLQSTIPDGIPHNDVGCSFDWITLTVSSVSVSRSQLLSERYTMR